MGDTEQNTGQNHDQGNAFQINENSSTKANPPRKKKKQGPEGDAFQINDDAENTKPGTSDD